MKKLYLVLCFASIFGITYGQYTTWNEKFTDLTESDDPASETHFNAMGQPETTFDFFTNTFLSSTPVVEVMIDKSGWDAFSFWCKTTDLTANPYIELRIQVTESVNLQVGLEDNAGGGFIWQNADITNDGEFHVVRFDFTSNIDNIAGDNIKQFAFQANGMGDYSGIFYIDYFKAGAHARADRNHEPTIDQIFDRYIDKNDDEQTVYISGIGDGDAGVEQTTTVTAYSFNQTLIPSVDVVMTTDSTGKLLFTPATDQIGEAEITVMVTDSGADEDDGGDPGDVNTTSSSFQVYVEGESIDELSSSLIDIYPNPVSNGVCNIILPDGLNVNTISVCDITGRILSSQAIQDEQNIQLILDQLPPGLYILSIEAKEGTIQSKLIIE